MTTTPTGDTVVGRIQGVRPCLRCGHDLHGQSIVRESEYGLFIARCPECGTTAALVEHPTLGLWGRRLGRVLMVTMLVAIVPLALLSSLGMFGIGVVLFEEQVREARDVLERMTGDVMTQITPEWWAAHAGEARRAVLGSFLDVDRDVAAMAVAFSPIPLLIGMIWSAILVGVPRRRVWIAGPVLAAIALIYVWILSLDNEPLGQVPVWTYRAAFQIGVWPVMGMLILAQTVLIVVGLLLGRSVLRGLARLVLPPRARRTMAFLWTLDGLVPPRGRA